jgi:hypothetical protein
MTIESIPQDSVLRERAIKRLKKKHEFYGHLLVYGLVNGFIVVIWALTNGDGFFWPVFPMVGWGIGVVMNAWDIYFNDELDETLIRSEMQRLQK